MMTGGGYDRTEFIARLGEATVSPAALPGSAAGFERLRAAVKAVRQPPRVVQPSKPPPIGSAISGRDFEVNANPVGLRSVRLDFDQDGLEARFSFTLSNALAPRVAGTYAMALGLDGRYRFNERGPRSGYQVGLKGQWLDDRTFQIRYAEPAGANQFNFFLRFNGDEIAVAFEDLTGLYGRHQLVGRAVK